MSRPVIRLSADTPVWERRAGPTGKVHQLSAADGTTTVRLLNDTVSGSTGATGGFEGIKLSRQKNRDDYSDVLRIFIHKVTAILLILKDVRQQLIASFAEAASFLCLSQSID